MTPTPHPTHHGPYTELTAEAARDLRRPISPDEVRFKVQAVRWTKRDGQDKVATAAQVVAYIDARTVVARLNLLFPGALAGADQTRCRSRCGSRAATPTAR